MSLIPNAWQTPNDFMDKYNPFLTSEEWRVLSYACRHILGWQDKIDSRMRRMSVSFFENGYSEYPGCGLKRAAIIKALDGLAAYGLMRKIGDPTREGQMWKLPSDENEIDLQGLKERQAQKEQLAVSRTNRARTMRKSGLSDTPVVSGTNRNVVSGTNQERLVGLTESKPSTKPSTKPKDSPPLGAPSAFEPFVEELFEADPEISLIVSEEQVGQPEELDITSRAALQVATRFFFRLKEPVENVEWSHLNMLTNFLSGQMKRNPKKTKQGEWFDNQLDEFPLDALDIIGMRFWWNDRFDGLSLEKPATIAEKAILYRLDPDRDKKRVAAERKLRKLMGLTVDIRPWANPVPTPQEDGAHSDEEVEAVLAELSDLFKGG
jgi:hypothetical protein